MSGTEATYHVTKEDIRKEESREAKRHGGEIPADSDVSAMKSIIDSTSKKDVIEERKANLPLPEDSPGPSDFNSADARTVNVGSGGVEEDITYGKGQSGMRDPATAESSARVDGAEWHVDTAPTTEGRQGHDNLSTLPPDAVTREAKKKIHSGT